MVIPPPDVQLRGTDEKMVEFKALAVVHRHVIKNYLNVSISEKLTPIAIAQKYLWVFSLPSSSPQGYFDSPQEAYPLVLLAIREGRKPR
ncbi:hypothetical protein LC605_31430 [Nostoc sp. CHAB 5836]|uniref:hypothetical protein n=1 Tax=Nostoc sp. CHAB 5836 TaxID=2780404 RepID=UPI001E2DB438|nr:hypothetical protein [Nostoc sp. CHAB 5836]MCC5619485.1 hypothetical protein [Nostoc sp. CHAB 5836]